MYKFYSRTGLRRDGLRPELQALFERLAIDPYAELFVRPDGMLQSGPDPKPETVPEAASGDAHSGSDTLDACCGQIKRCPNR